MSPPLRGSIVLHKLHQGRNKAKGMGTTTYSVIIPTMSGDRNGLTTIGIVMGGVEVTANMLQARHRVVGLKRLGVVVVAAGTVRGGMQVDGADVETC